MIEALDQHANLLVVGVTVILVCVTIAYAYFTWCIVKEMQMTREGDLRPYIVTSTIVSGQMFYLVIKNNGKTAAQKVRFKFDKSVENIWRKKIDELPLFKDGVTFFPPGKEFVITLGQAGLFLSEKRDEIKYPSTFTISVEYSYFGGKQVCETTVINLEEYMHTNLQPNEIVKSIERLDESLKRSLDSIAMSTEKLSKIESIASPSGIDISQGSMYWLSEIFNEKATKKIKLNLNLATLSELVGFLGITQQIAEKILELRESNYFLKSFDELKQIEGMTDELFEKITRQTFLCNPYL